MSWELIILYQILLSFMNLSYPMNIPGISILSPTIIASKPSFDLSPDAPNDSTRPSEMRRGPQAPVCRRRRPQSSPTWAARADGEFHGDGMSQIGPNIMQVHVCGVNFWETLSKIWHSSSSFWHWKEGSVMPVDAEMAFAEDFQIRRRKPNLFLLSGETILKEHMMYQQPINSQFYKKPTCVFSAAPNHVYGSPFLCVRFMVYCPNLANWTESFM